MTDTAGPVVADQRITNLDTIRGIAVLGILLMNAVAFGLDDGAYYNLDADGSDTAIDWAIGVFGEVFVDQKFMGLFSLLFGAGIVLFTDRAEVTGRRPVALSLSRNAVLLVIGVLHSLAWEGDVLLLYAAASPLLLAVRNLPPPVLIGGGLAVIAASPVAAVLAQGTVDDDGTGLGWIWGVAGDLDPAVETFLIVDAFARAIGMMMIGMALYRTGLVNGTRPPDTYRRLAAWGFGVGVPLTVASVVWFAVTDFGPEAALVGSIPNTIGTVPLTIGYVALISRWNQRPDTAAHRRLRATGRMALTNYLSQTVLGLTVLGWALADIDLTRSAIVAFCAAVWAAQLAWSPWWLARYRFGPIEWLWRVATYRRMAPLRR